MTASGSEPTYDVVLLVEQPLSEQDARQVRGLHDALEEHVRYHLLLPVEDAAARVESAMGSLAASEVLASPALVMSEDRANELSLKPRARIIASSVSGVAPEMMGIGPIVAIQRVLDLAGMTIDQIEIVELNEAFAAQVIPIMAAHNIPLEKLNPHGGAIALGHPFGMTGVRIMATLLNGLETDDKTIGLETMCVGGGQGMAMIVERLN